MNHAAMKFLTIFAVIASTSAFQPSCIRVLLSNNNRNDNFGRQEPTQLDYSGSFWWDTLPGTPKYTKKSKPASKPDVAKATEELEKFVEDYKTSIEEANSVLKAADAVLSSTANKSSEEEEDWSSMTVPMLKQALKDRGLKVSGKKADLVDRLEGYQSEMAVEANEDAEQEEVAVVAKEEEAVEMAAEESEEDDWEWEWTEDDNDDAEEVETVAAEESEEDDWEWEWTEDDNDDAEEVETVDYSSMTVAKLKEELKTLGLSVTGKKADLIARLESQNDATTMESPEPVVASIRDDDDSKPTVVTDKVDYSGHTVAELKVELRKKGLKVGGKKAELIERLQSA